MIFIRLFAWRSIKYFATLSIVLTIMVTLVQFFERILSARQATLQDLIYFLAVDTLPTWISLFPIAIWLTTACLLREWQLRGEWDLMMMININPIKLLQLFIGLSCAISILLIILQESCTLHLAHLSNKFKHEKIKKNEQVLLVNKHLALSSTMFATIGSYDQISYSGDSLSFFEITPSFSSFQQIKYQEKFSLQDKSLNKSLCLQLDTQKRPASLYDYITNPCPLPPEKSVEYHNQLFRYIMTIFDLILLAPLSFLLFITSASAGMKQWFSIFGLYPLLFFLKFFSISISQRMHFLFIFFPYIFFVILFFALIKEFYQKLLLKKS